MSAKSKLYLAVSVIAMVLGLCFVIGLIKVQSTAALYATLPVGAIFFGMFLVGNVFEKEESDHRNDAETP